MISPDPELILTMQKSMVNFRIELGLYQDDVDRIVGLPIGSCCRYENIVDGAGNSCPYGTMSIKNFQRVYARFKAYRDQKISHLDA